MRGKLLEAVGNEHSKLHPSNLMIGTGVRKPLVNARKQVDRSVEISWMRDGFQQQSR
jgi:hypothetical protein